MKSALIALPLALGTALYTTAQDPPPTEQDPPAREADDEEVERDIFGRVKKKRPGTKASDEAKSLEGMWQLVAMELEGFPPEGLTPVAYLLIGDRFLAFEMQAYYDENVLDDDPYVDGYQTFMAEYEVVSGQQLICNTLIGSYLDEEDDILDYEPPGIVREFTLERTGKLLTLRFGEDDWMTFGRRMATGTGVVDIYGRSRGTRTKLGPDVYGREKTKEELAGKGKKDG